MTKSNALYWQEQAVSGAIFTCNFTIQADSHVTNADHGSFEIVDGEERYLVEVRVFDLGGNE